MIIMKFIRYKNYYIDEDFSYYIMDDFFWSGYHERGLPSRFHKVFLLLLSLRMCKTIREFGQDFNIFSKHGKATFRMFKKLSLENTIMMSAIVRNHLYPPSI